MPHADPGNNKSNKIRQMMVKLMKPINSENLFSLSGSCEPESCSGRYGEYRRIWEENPRNFVLRSFPIHLDIEPTSRCNLRCRFCDKRPLLSKDQIGDIELPLYHKIIDEGKAGGLCSVQLSYRGEPLLHPNLSDMIRYAKEQSILEVSLCTNGMLLTPHLAEGLIDAGLDRITVSIDGIDSENYENERLGAKFAVVLRNVECLKEFKTKLKVKIPKVRIQSVAQPNMDWESYRRYWEPYCDEVAVVGLRDMNDTSCVSKADWACPQLWQRMTVEWDGTILPCSNDDLRRLSPGNAKVITITEAWNHPMVNQVRDMHRLGNSDKVPDCAACRYRIVQLGGQFS